MIRQAVLYDFRRKDLEFEPRLKEGEEAAPEHMPPADMWRDWTDEVKQTPRHWSLAVAEEQRLIGARVGGVVVTRENAAQPLDLIRAQESSVSAKM